jgi:hypothetical protein
VPGFLRHSPRRLRLAALVAGLVLGGAAVAVAHDIPADVTVQAFFKPEGQRLRLLVRVPLRAMLDIDFPKRGPGYLDLARVDPALRDAATMWILDNVEVYEEDTNLAVRRVAAALVSLPSERSFGSYEEALSHVSGPRLANDTELFWDQGMLDALIEYPIHSDRSNFAIHPGFARLGVRVVTILRFLPPTGGVRAFEFTGDPGMVRLDPSWRQAALTFVNLGFHHILDGSDHLLFLFCLVIPFRRFRSLVVVVTSFTIAHSITLLASAYGIAPDALWFPPLVETLIAVSIVYMALENIVGARLRRRWLIAFAFGLVHGFGFSFALRQTLQLAGSHLLASLLSFNVGVELGQLLVLALMVPALTLLFRVAVAERMGTIILSALVAHTAWHWMIDRGERLRQFRFAWPPLGPAELAVVTGWALAVLVAAGGLWLAATLIRHRAVRRAEHEAGPV